MTIHGRFVTPWDPAVGSADAPVPDQWLDASDTSTISKAGPLTITSGATVFEWRTKAGTLRKYRLIGPNLAPTWTENVVGSLGGVRCNGNVLPGQMLSADVLTGMRNLSGRTVIAAFKYITSIPTFEQGFTVTVPHQIGSADGAQLIMYCAQTTSTRGRVLQADASVQANFLDANGGIHVNTAGGSVVEVVTGIHKYAAGTMQVLSAGVQGPTIALTSSGNTANLDPYAMSVGGILQENGARGTNTGNGFMDGYVLEVLDWFRVLTPDQLVGPHDYMCNKWGSGLM